MAIVITLGWRVWAGSPGWLPMPGRPVMPTGPCVPECGPVEPPPRAMIVACGWPLGELAEVVPTLMIVGCGVVRMVGVGMGVMAGIVDGMAASASFGCVGVSAWTTAGRAAGIGDCGSV